MMNVIGEVSRQRFDFSKYADQDDWDDWDAEEEAVTEDLASENEKLKAELAKLRKQAKEANYNLSRENRELKDQLEKWKPGRENCGRNSQISGKSCSISRMGRKKKSRGKQDLVPVPHIPAVSGFWRS